MSLVEKARSVRTREEFVEFIEALAAADQSAWTNRSLSEFLSAMAGWTQDMDGFYLNRKEPPPTQPSWQVLADILMAATLYE